MYPQSMFEGPKKARLLCVRAYAILILSVGNLSHRL